MILFHFTAVEHLPAILTEGLSKGDIPVEPGEPGYRGVWFTTDREPSLHGLSGGEMLTLPEAERRLIERNTGRPAPFKVRTLDKRAVRIQVATPLKHKKLFAWLQWSAKRTNLDLREALILAGGGKQKARTWYVYNGVIPPNEFREICIRDKTGKFTPATDEELRNARSGSG